MAVDRESGCFRDQVLIDSHVLSAFLTIPAFLDPTERILSRGRVAGILFRKSASGRSLIFQQTHQSYHTRLEVLQKAPDTINVLGERIAS